MATYASHDTATNEDDADTLTITKPSGLAAGDFMIAVLGMSGDNAITWALTGWTELVTLAASNILTSVLYKDADADDAAATNFAFTHSNGGTASRAGILYRITGTFAGAANLTYDGFDAVGADATPEYTTGVTPAGTTALLIMGAVTSTAATTSSTYAVANNNPTWTERGDLSVDGTADITLSSATGSYTVGTTTGTYSLTLSGAVTSRGYIVSISDNEN